MSGTKRILVVEDDPSLQQTVRKHLTRRGFEVATAHDSASARELLRKSVPDLICLDLHLPRESGYELCEMIRSEMRLRDVKIVLLGEGRSPEARAHAEEAGANAYLPKPFTLPDLDGQVDSLLG